MIYVTEMRKKLIKICFVESSFGQKVRSTFPIAQCRVATPFQWCHCCLLLNEIKVFFNLFWILYINIWSVHADA